MDNLVEKHNIDYVVHGDDPCIGVRPVQGHDVPCIMETFSWIPLRTRTHAPTRSFSCHVASCPWVFRSSQGNVSLVSLTVRVFC